MNALGRWVAAAIPGVSGFATPLWIALGLPAVVLGLWAAARRHPPALAWSALATARAAGASRRDLVRSLGLLLRGASCVALVLALAGPLGPEVPVLREHPGLDLVLVVDASGSMRALDALVDGRRMTRLALAREAVSRFALHRVAAGDRVGLVVFGERAFTDCPLTSDGALLAAALDRVEAGMAGDATALGDALALAVKRVSAADAHSSGPLPARSEPKPREAGPHAPRAGRLVVLLTDGRSNAGAVPLQIATDLAVERGVRVDTVGIGTRNAVEMASQEGGPPRPGLEHHDLDAQVLERIAAATGGRFFEAQSSSELGAVYRAIDRAERIPRRTPALRVESQAPEPFLATAAGLLLLEVALIRVAWRRLP